MKLYELIEIYSNSPDEVYKYCKENMDKFKKTRKSSQFIEYLEVLKEGENIRVYKDKITVVNEVGEYTLTSDFNYYKFYSNVDDLIISLIIGKATGYMVGMAEALLSMYHNMYL